MDDRKAYDQCVRTLETAFLALDISVPAGLVIEIAELIVEPMTGPWRFFHTPEHIFEVGGQLVSQLEGSVGAVLPDPIEMLAALFHDLVYVQVDHSIGFNLSYHLAPWVQARRGKLVIREQTNAAQASLLSLVMGVFAFQAGMELDPYGGQNEFLSALVAAKILAPWLSGAQLLKVLACIEATIPFRRPQRGESVSEGLYRRLQGVNDSFQLELGAAELYEVVQKAVRVSNRDVGSFAHASSAHFLANTWNLIPETNHSIVVTSAYRVCDYRRAIQKMECFMQILYPDLIFRRFGDEPSPEVHAELLQQAQHNLDVARLYLGTKLVAIALIEALSLSVGVDVPLSAMMGEVCQAGAAALRLERFLPTYLVPEHHPKTGLEVEVMELLVRGRAKASHDADLDQSPLAAFLVKAMGFEEIRHHRLQALRWFDGEIDGAQFLGGLPSTVVMATADALVKLFETRKSAIANFHILTCVPSVTLQPS
jgi:hypothetical protein